MTPFRTHSRRWFACALLGILIAAWGVADTRAQSGMRSVSAVGTGGGTSALDTGPAALFANPAALTADSSSYSLELQLLRVGVYAGGGAVQYTPYNTLFVHEAPDAPLSNAEEKAVLDDWFGDSQQSVASYVEVMPLAVTYRPSDQPWAAGLGLRTRTIQKTGMDKGLLDLILRGTSPSRTIPINADSRVYSTIDLKGAFSYRLSALPLSVGVSPTVIFGLGYAGVDFNSRAVVSADSLVHRFDYTARAAGPPSTGLFQNVDLFGNDLLGAGRPLGTYSGLSGMGAGLDFGATYTVRPTLYASLAVTDLGWIRWTRDAQVVTPTNNAFRFDGIEDAPLSGNLGDRIESEVDSLIQATYEDVERSSSSFSTGLPTTLHLNGTWDRQFVVLNGGVSVGLNGAAGAVPDPLALHLGGTLTSGPIPVHAGLRLWGTQAVTVSGGLGLDLGGYQFEIGGSLTPNTSLLGSGARYALSLSLGTIRI